MQSNNKICILYSIEAHQSSYKNQCNPVMIFIIYSNMTILVINYKLQYNMAAFRSCSQFDCKNSNFIAVVIALLSVFSIYVIEFIFRDGQYMIVPWLILTSFFFVMAMWSYVAVVVTQPGNVPLYWGMYQDIHKQRKYCLVCHNFKPERSHHCSKCKKCILNMDHHCPWINNCVGFYNRKYFLLFIFYLLIAIILALIQMTILIYSQFKQIFNHQSSVSFHTILRIIQFLFCLLILVSVFIFFVTHMRMVFQNITTIEQMLIERKKRGESKNTQNNNLNTSINEFDINSWYNFTQVFGKNPFYWLIPVQQEEKLRGRGLYWQKKSIVYPSETVKEKDEAESLKCKQMGRQVSKK